MKKAKVPRLAPLTTFPVEGHGAAVAGLDGSWDFVEKDLTLVTSPDAGHFVQQDAPELVTRSIRSWLAR